MRSEDVAGSVLDVAFARDELVPQALNIVNPCRPPWEKIMSFIRDALLKQKPGSLTREALGMIPITEWVAVLEKRAENATPEDLDNIVSISHRSLETLYGTLIIFLLACNKTARVLPSDGEA
jgi:hypothetical protein